MLLDVDSVYSMNSIDVVDGVDIVNLTMYLMGVVGDLIIGGLFISLFEESNDSVTSDLLPSLK